MRNPPLVTFRYSPDRELTKDECVENCKLALRLWRERVKPEQVIPHLRVWRCGTTACFGGHLATWPEFTLLPKARITINGMPYFTPSASVDLFLFGASMFHIEETRNEHQVIVERLEIRIRELTV